MVHDESLAAYAGTYPRRVTITSFLGCCCLPGCPPRREPLTTSALSPREDYYQDLDHLTAKDQTILFRLVEEHPGIFLSEVQRACEIPPDLINIAIARHDLYMD